MIQQECSWCDGGGKVHSPGCNGDPDDDGVPCEYCDGHGVIEVEPEEDLDHDGN